MDTVQIINFTANFILILKNLIVYAIIGRILMSWFTMGQSTRRPGRITQFLHDVTEPVIGLARKIPHRIGMMDFSPLIALLGVDMLGQLVVLMLFKLA